MLDSASSPFDYRRRSGNGPRQITLATGVPHALSVRCSEKGPLRGRGKTNMATLSISHGLSPAVEEQIERVVASELIRGSDALCRILRFLGRNALDSPDTSVKEFILATQVLGRDPSQYDSSLDSCVRVQVMRLRAKLAQYYAGPGAADPIVITIPRGAYKLVLEERSVPIPAPSAPIDDEPRFSRPTLSRFRSPLPVGLVGALCLLFGLLLGIALTLSAGAAGKLAP